MRKPSYLIAGLFTVATLGLAGCDVEKPQEGKVDVPKYEVTKTEEGKVHLPKYDVDAPRVGVTTTEKQVTVPDVDVNARKESITVPKVEVTPAQDRDDEKKVANGK